MKKLILFISLLFATAISFGQTLSPIGGPNVDSRVRGILSIDTGGQFRTNYPDTATLNQSLYLRSRAGMIARVENTLWMRSQDTTQWIGIGGQAVEVDNTNTISLSGIGIPEDPIIADLIISSQDGNAIQQFSDGVYVANQVQNGVIRGGIRSWVSGYTYDVTEVLYAIGGVTYLAPETQVTLDNADPTNNRIDLIVANNDNTITVITGTPSANPEQPSYDPETQVPLGFVLVTANTVEPPDVEQDYIYLNNAEWTTSSSTARINPASTSNPFSPPLDIEFTAARNNDSITLTDPTQPTDMADFSILTFKIRSKATWANTSRITFRFFNDGVAVGVPVSLGNSNFGFSSSNTASYQTISIQKSFFGALTDVDLLFITVVTVGNATIGAYLDDIQLQGGSGTLVPSTGNFWTVGGNLLGTTLIGGTLDNNYVQFIANNTNHTQLLQNGSTWMQGSNPGISLFLGDFTNGDYYIRRSATTVSYNSAGAHAVQLSGSTVYGISAANGHIWSLAAAQQMVLAPTGALRLNNYGDNTFTGTPTYLLGVDVDGNVVETSVASAITADNGLNMSTATNAQWGGTLIQNTQIDAGAFHFDMTGAATDYTMQLTNSGGTVTVLSVVNSNGFLNGGAIRASSNASSFGSVILGTATDGAIGVSGTSVNNYGLAATSNHSSTNINRGVLSITRTTSGTAANGISGSIDFSVEYTGATGMSNSIQSKWTDVTAVTRTSQLVITGVSGATTADIFTLDGDGGLRLNTYGVSTHTGTAAYVLAVDASGNVIEIATGGGSMINPMTTTGDIIYSSDGSGTPARLGIGTSGQVLTVSAGGIPEWTTVVGTGSVTDVSFTGGLISVSDPTTTPALTVAGTSGGGVYFSSTSTWASTGLLAANAIMIGGGAGAAYSTTTTGTGVLTALGINVGSAGAFITFNGAGGTPSSITLTNGTGLPLTTGVTGTLDETNGGTGTATYATGDILYASASNTLSKLTAGTDGFVLTLAAGVPTWAAATAGGTVTSVAMSVPSFLSVSGSPITTSGTFAVSLSGTALPIANGGTGLTSDGTGNQILGVESDGSGLEYKTVTAGVGMTISHGVGSVTVTSNFNPTWQTLSDGATVTWNVANGGNGVVTLASTGRTLSITNPVIGYSYTIRIIQGSGGSKTITTWPTNTKWAGGTAPTLSTTAGQYDIVSFIWDGTNYYGTYQNNFQ